MIGLLNFEQLMRDPEVANNKIMDHEPVDKPLPLPVDPPQEELNEPIMPLAVDPPQEVENEPMPQEELIEIIPLAVDPPQEVDIDDDNNRFIICRNCMINRARVIFTRCTRMSFCLGCHQAYKAGHTLNNIPFCPVCNADCREYLEAIYLKNVCTM